MITSSDVVMSESRKVIMSRCQIRLCVEHGIRSPADLQDYAFMH